MDNTLIFHFSTAASLLSGCYCGDTRIEDVLDYGNFGLGTLNNLAGELIILKNIAFVAYADGTIKRVPGYAKTPFAVITRFLPNTGIVYEDIAFNSLNDKIISLLPSIQNFAAICISGVFNEIVCRGSDGISDVNPDLASVVKNSALIHKKDIEGDMVGFYIPDHVNGVNIPGFHFHFIDKKMQVGGHIVDFEIKHACIQIDVKSDCRVI